MSGTVKRHWNLEGRDRGETFEVRGLLLQRGLAEKDTAHLVYVVGCRAGLAGVHVSRHSRKGHRIEAYIYPRVDPPGDIREAIDLRAEIGRCAAVIARMPIVGGYARDNTIDTFIDFTPIPEEGQAEARSSVAAALGMPESHILGFDK